MTPQERSISVIIPALNEESKIEKSVENVLAAVKRSFTSYEIILVNDGSTDNTGLLCETMKKSNLKIKTIHNDTPLCLGGVYKKALKIARMEYVILINGKNDASTAELEKTFSLCGQADMIIPYLENPENRPFTRRFLSATYTRLVNTIFQLNLRYYNHSVLHKRKLVSAIPIRTNSYAYQTEILIKLIKSGYTYVETGQRDNFAQGIQSKAFTIANILGVVRFLGSMVLEVQIRKEYGARYVANKYA